MALSAEANWQRIRSALSELYPPADAAWLIEQCRELAPSSKAAAAEPQRLSERDACCIAYADSIIDPDSGSTPLQAFAETVSEFELAKPFPVVHLLPFFPWDTDRGFSVRNYYEVAEENGSWEDITALAESVRLMFDFVANHASIENPLVQNALIARHLQEDDLRYAAAAPYEGYIIAFSRDEAPSSEALAALARPRSAPVLTPYCVLETEGGALRAVMGGRDDPKVPADACCIGEGLVWTTFSRGPDKRGSEATRQVDLNFKNPKVLIETLRILLFYAGRGATLIRLDAVGYLWKKLGSSSLHERETHQLLVCLNALMKICAPGVLTVAEVNESQEHVVRYLGEPGREESDMVYQFSHFPLAVHAIYNGTAKYYARWLATLPQFGGRQFITVLGSHDGMGMKPVRGLLPEEEIEAMLARAVEKYGGLPNYAVLPGGGRIVYEVCSTPWRLLNRPDSGETAELQQARYLAVAALGLLVRGLPAFYINGIFARDNYLPDGGLDENRTVNRERMHKEQLRRSLRDAGSRSAAILQELRRMLELRALQPAFSPEARAAQPIAVEDDRLLICRLPAVRSDDELLAAVNVSNEECSVYAESFGAAGAHFDLLAGRRLSLNKGRLELSPYQVCWLKAEEG